MLAAGGLAGAISKTATAPLARITILNQVHFGGSPCPMPRCPPNCSPSLPPSSPAPLHVCGLTGRPQVQGMPGAAAGPALQTVRGLGIFSVARGIVQSEGWLALWKVGRPAALPAFSDEGQTGSFSQGNGVTLVHRLPYSATNFYVYETVLEAMAQWRREAGSDPGGGDLLQDMGRRLTAGAIAGCTAVAMAYPLDLVRTRLAAQTRHQYYQGITHALATIATDEVRQPAGRRRFLHREPLQSASTFRCRRGHGACTGA